MEYGILTDINTNDDELNTLIYMHEHSLVITEHLDRKGSFLLTIGGVFFPILIFILNSFPVQITYFAFTSMILVFISIISCIGVFFSWFPDKIKADENKSSSKDKKKIINNKPFNGVLFYQHINKLSLGELVERFDSKMENKNELKKNFLHDILEMSKRMKCKSNWLQLSIILFLFGLVFLSTSVVASLSLLNIWFGVIIYIICWVFFILVFIVSIITKNLPNIFEILLKKIKK